MPDQARTELYGLPLAEFIPARTARVKALRGDKRRDEAAQVAALRKPSVAAWAVNQLVRTQGKAIKRLFAAGDAIATAQRSGKADGLRRAGAEQRAAIDGLMSAAEGLLSSDGHPLSPATLERVRETLRAASIDPDSRAQVAGGCLTQELQFAGLGIGDLPVAVADTPASAQTKAKAKAKAGRPEAPDGDAVAAAPDPAADRARQAAAEHQRQAAADRDRKAALAAARKAETAARRQADRAVKALEAAERDHAEAEAALQAARAGRDRAREAAEAARAELEQAERAVRLATV